MEVIINGVKSDVQLEDMGDAVCVKVRGFYVLEINKKDGTPRRTSNVSSKYTGLKTDDQRRIVDSEPTQEE